MDKKVGIILIVLGVIWAVLSVFFFESVNLDWGPAVSTHSFLIEKGILLGEGYAARDILVINFVPILIILVGLAIMLKDEVQT